MQQTIAEKFADFLSPLSYDRIPREVIEKAKDLVLDTLGVCIGSAKMDFGEAVLGLVGGWGGASDSSLVGAGARVPAQNAVFANGVLGHGQDYDDTHTESVVHPSACLVPAALAVGERNDCSGRDVLVALVGGLEVMIRIGMPALNKFHLRGFHTTSICGTFASALITAKLAGLDRDKMVEALGISGSFTSGLLECIPSGSSAKRLHAGWAGLCGVMAADLARVGYTGPRTVFEGHLGVYNSFLRSETLDLSTIFKDLGREWEVLNIRPKLYPCCHYLQSFLDCASRLRKEHSLDPKDVVKIDCRIARGSLNFICEPWAKKLIPTTSYEARFSLPFAVSLMLTKGKAGVNQFSDDYLSDPEIGDMMRKVSYEIEPTFEVKDMPGWITVTLRNGDKLESRIDQVRGDAANPVARDELLEKFHENAASIGREKGERIAGKIWGLEHVGNVRALMRELS